MCLPDDLLRLVEGDDEPSEPIDPADYPDLYPPFDDPDEEIE